MSKTIPDYGNGNAAPRPLFGPDSSEVFIPSLNTTFTAAVKDGVISVTSSGSGAVAAEVAEFHCAAPYLFLDGEDNLYLFYTAVHCAMETDAAQPMYAVSPKGSYFEDKINWRITDAVYPRLGGSFTDARQSAGVNEQEDRFAPELCRRYEKIGETLAEKEGFSRERFQRFVAEKRDLALGKLYGVKIDKNHYPYARRFGFCLRGMPIETRFDGKTCTVLPIYSDIFSCALLVFSFDGENFDGHDYILCSLGRDEEFVLEQEGEGLSLSIKSSSGLLPVGKTKDLGRTWENLYDPALFVPVSGTGEEPRKEKKWYRQYRARFLRRPTPIKFFKLAAELIKNERLMDFSNKKDNKISFTDYEQVKIKGLEGYAVPVAEDIFPLIKEHAHGSGIACLHNGELISVWFQSDGERRGNDGRILAARKPVDGVWREPFVIADVAGMADCNPTVYVDREDNLWLFWYPVLANCWETSQTKYRKAPKGSYEYANGFTLSPDWADYGILNPSRPEELQGRAIGFENNEYIYGPVNGECRYITEEQFKENPLKPEEYVKIEDRYITDSFVVALRNSTKEAVNFARFEHHYAGMTPFFEIYLWQEAERICRIAAGVNSPYKKWKPITRALGWQTKNKPLEFDYNGKTRLLLPLYSDGIHCSLTAYTDDGGKTWGYGLPFASTAPEQAADVDMQNGSVRSYFRNGEPANHVISYISTDGGHTYGNLRKEPALKHEGGFDIVKLDNSLWAMSITDAYKGKGARAHNRSRLQIAVSSDEGKTWSLTPLELDTKGRREYHYSAITKGADGTIYVSYSYDDEKGLNNIRCATIKRL